MSEKPKDIKQIFAEALKLGTAEERAAYLNRACGEDAALRAEVESLLDAHEGAGDFLDTAAIGLVGSQSGLPEIDGPGAVIGRYKLLQVIGEGGFGIVYMAEQQEPIHRRVALKIIKLGMDTKQVIARFEAERQALAMMDHPNIAKVFDAGATETGRPYFVMELVKGVPVTEYCDTNMLDTKQRLALFQDVCSAVQHAHHKGIIHRDIKPSNVMITLHDGTPVPKVIDFGIAKAIQQRLTEKTLFTEFHQFIGTPQYMSPEQAEMSGLDIDTRTDIYSLGVLLYELLTGTTPYEAKQLRGAAYDEIRRIIRETDPPKPSTRLSTLGDALTNVAKHRHIQPGRLRKMIAGDLDWIAMKSLEKDRTRRYATANELAQDVGRYLADEMVLAGPPSVVYRLQKWTRRHKAASITTVAVVLLAVVAGSVFTVQRRQKLERTAVIAEEGLANARVAMASGDYSGVQRELTYVNAQLDDEATLTTRYGAAVDSLLSRAELKLRLGRYETLRQSARYAAQPLMGLLPECWGLTEKELNARLVEARDWCREALGIFNVVDNPEWQNDLDQLPLDPDEVQLVRDSVAELLFMLADAEHRIGKSGLACCGNLGTKRAIARLDQIEELNPDLRSLYAYRSSYRALLRRFEGAREDSVRCETIEPSTWLDHWLLAHKAWPDQERTIAHLESALALNVDDYWTWYAWGLAFEWAEDFDEERIHHAMSVCVNLNPQEAAGWIGRGAHGMSPSPSGREAAVADLTRGLELTDGPGLRSLAHYYRGVALSQMGDMDAALLDLSRAVDAKTNFPEHLVTRGELYLTLGDRQRADADFRELLDRFPRPAKPGEYIWRIRALRHLEEWETVIEECRLQVEHPNNYYGNDTMLAYAHYRLGRYQEAARIMQRTALAADCLISSMIQWKLGRKDEARALYRKATDRIRQESMAVMSGSRIGRYESEAANLIGIPNSERPKLIGQKW
ncbi:protein kinase [Candidatus Eisenbacteria bacterium]|uniref:Protein kinase n=1 Tax=Eiseniibacteriota bacterium TaxID=2212470 RepID=A0ABV6YIR3_UNCEI